MIIVGIFCLLVAAAGWFYMFYSRAAQKLAAIEDPQINRRRVRLRRVGGAVIIGLAVVFYIACDALDREQFARAGALMVLVLPLMAALLVLGLIDLRLTRRLRRGQDSATTRPPSQDKPDTRR